MAPGFRESIRTGGKIQEKKERENFLMYIKIEILSLFIYT